jgi:site-specific recombinase XerD
MNGDLEQLLKNLKLKRIAQILDREIERAEQHPPSYAEFLQRLLREEYHDQQRRFLDYRIRNACLRERWMLDTFPWERQPGVHRSQIEQLAELDFIARAANIVFIGQAGVGKTGLAGFTEFLVREGYPREPLRRHVRTTSRVDGRLRQRGCRALADITRDDLHACAPAVGRSQDDANAAASVRLLERYLDDRGLLPPLGPPTPIECKLDDYAAYLRQVRGLAPGTIQDHRTTAAQFIHHVDPEGRLSALLQVTGGDIEEFLRCSGSRLGRGTMQHVVSQLRAFLRFLAARGEAPTGLNSRIDTPRLYRGEQLPRALPWETVRAFLHAIDRATPIGRRDYAMFLLIATYGLRTCEVVGLQIEDLAWRARQLIVHQQKVASPLLLPLTDAVGDSLLAYLRCGRPSVPTRQVFVRHRAPAGVLKPTAVTEAFQAWSRRSDLKIPFQGPHCLRHYADIGISATPLPFKPCCGGIKRATTFRQSCHCSPLIWDTCPSSPPRTYLRFIDQVAACASERFAQRCGALVTHPAVGAPKGGAR